MKHANQRNIKLIDELMSFCYSHGASKIDISINTVDGVATIILAAEIHNLDPEVIESMTRLLNAPRSHEMEEYFWELTGDDDSDSELTLVGMMTDEAHVDYKDSSCLEIFLKRRM
jgi:hypothetical protein